MSVYIRDELLEGVLLIHGETSDYMWVELKRQFFHVRVFSLFLRKTMCCGYLSELPRT